MVGIVRMEYVSVSRDGLDRIVYRIKMNVYQVYVKMGVFVIIYLDFIFVNVQMDILDNIARLDLIIVYLVRVKMVVNVRMNWMVFIVSVFMNFGEIGVSMCLKVFLNSFIWSLI